MRDNVTWTLVMLVTSLCLLVACTSNAAPSSGSADAGPSSNSSSSSSSSSSSQTTGTIAAVDVPVMLDDAFGGVYIDKTIDEFNKLGFNYGDSVDVKFSNGYELNDIPYFTGYYVDVDAPLVLAYPGYPHVEVTVNYGDSLWRTAGLSEGDTATITLHEPRKHLAVQETLGVSYRDEREAYESDEQFANFRAMTGGNITSGMWYRSASPVDNTHGRAAYASKLAQQMGINYILDLSDNADEIAEEMAANAQTQTDVSYFTELLEAGKVGLLDLPANYMSQEFKEKLAEGLIELPSHDGPYLVHCVEGKDRTGFVCILLKALAGATYDELKADYMKTYENYYAVNEQDAPKSYAAIVELYFDSMLAYLAGVDAESADLQAIDYREFAIAYLHECGMTDEQIDTLAARL